MIAVGEPPSPPPWHSFAYAPLTYVAGLYRAAGDNRRWPWNVQVTPYSFSRPKIRRSMTGSLGDVALDASGRRVYYQRDARAMGPIARPGICQPRATSASS
jgi:hypothetical protein